MIKSLKEITSEDFFDFESQANKEIYETRLKPWLVKAEKTFTKERFIEIFTSISYQSLVQSREQEMDLSGNPATGKCKCNKSEDYCWFSDCDDPDCESTYSGCGVAWGKPCDALCT